MHCTGEWEASHGPSGCLLGVGTVDGAYTHTSLCELRTTAPAAEPRLFAWSGFQIHRCPHTSAERRPFPARRASHTLNFERISNRVGAPISTRQYYPSAPSSLSSFSHTLSCTLTAVRITHCAITKFVLRTQPHLETLRS